MGTVRTEGGTDASSDATAQTQKQTFKVSVFEIPVECPLFNHRGRGPGQGTQHRGIHRNHAPSQRSQA